MTFKRLLVSLLLAFLLGLMLSERAIAQSTSLQTQAASSARAAKKSAIEGLWSLRLQQKRFEDSFNQDSTTEFRLLADLNYKPLESMSFRLAPQFTYNNGFSQTVEGNRATESQWGVKEASANVAITPNTLLSAGALDQSADHPALLLADQTFPALRFRLQSSQEETFSAGLTAQTAIPTSSSLSTQTREFEKTPSFNSGSLLFRLKTIRLLGEVQAGAFAYQNLPSSVATASTYLGNSTVSSTGNSMSEFVTEFQGTFATASFEARLPKSIRLHALAEWVQNSKATPGLDQGMRSLIGADFRASRSVNINPFYEFFQADPDSAVALYNGSWINTNRKGYQGGLTLAYQKTLKFTASAGEREVVYKSPFQQRERTWNLKLETFDVAI